MKISRTFNFATGKSTAYIRQTIPPISQILKDLSLCDSTHYIIVCDTNTLAIARQVASDNICVLKSGEDNKNWSSCETVLKAARDAELGRDGLIVGVGGGVITDLTAFCASIYMRGLNCALVSTTLLGMVDASFGGKTGFDLFGIKNIVGTFYPARCVYMCTDSLAGIAPNQWKSGMAEVIKTAILDGSFAAKKCRKNLLDAMHYELIDAETLCTVIANAVFYKAKLVLADPKETKGKRALLNLGHTFGHALESFYGLGNITHGEAVAWGIICACKLGVELHISPVEYADTICAFINEAGYETLFLKNKLDELDKSDKSDKSNKSNNLSGIDQSSGDKTFLPFMQALYSDKKKKSGTLNFVLPLRRGAIIHELKPHEKDLLSNLLRSGNV
ncbi:3-dehydroquinate synthase [Spirochaetia bacterium]|nr:3-dehydroquinate synthase [Spirochaetia bacterium]